MRDARAGREVRDDTRGVVLQLRLVDGEERNNARDHTGLLNALENDQQLRADLVPILSYAHTWQCGSHGISTTISRRCALVNAALPRA